LTRSLYHIWKGGSFSLETAPFKLTEEMVEVLGGLDSMLFRHFVSAFIKGFIALQASVDNLVAAIKTLAIDSSFPCFAGISSLKTL
jgi:phosphatidylinositol kinase/protein kinase (PI-3  family)